MLGSQLSSSWILIAHRPDTSQTHCPSPLQLDDIGDVKEMVIKWLAVSVAVYLNAGSPPQDYSLSAGTFIKSKQGDIDVGAMLNNFLTHPTERHVLGVRIIHTQPEGVYEWHEFGRSVPCILEGGLLLILRAKGNVEFLSCVRVIITA